MHRRQDRRRRSRSPSRHVRPHDSRSRSRRRSSRQGRRQLPTAPRLPPTHNQWEDIKKLPSHWKPTSDMLDYNTVYGMSLPRRVVSTGASRSLGIDNLPVHEIRLIQVLQDSSYDWCLRQVAAGKTCYRKCSDHGKRHSSAQLCTAIYVTPGSTSARYYKQRQHLTTRRAISQCGKTGRWQVQNLPRLLEIT